MSYYREPKYSKNEVLEKIKQLYLKLGRVPRQSDLKTEDFSHGIGLFYFGTWNETLRACGLSPNSICPATRPSRKEIRRNFISLVEKLGYVPTMTECRKFTKDIGCNVCTVATEYGSFNDFLRDLNYPVKQPGALVDRVYEILKSKYPDVLREYRTSWLINKKTKRKLPCDFYIPSLKLFIEYDDESHFELSFYIRKGTSLDSAKKRFKERKYFDKLRDRLIPKNGYNLLRFKFNESLAKDFILNRVESYKRLL